MIIAVDFDGTVVEHKYPEVGNDVPYAEEVLNKLIKNNHQLILFTMRSGKELQDAVDWYKEKNIPLYGINTNPTQKNWTQSPKAYAQLYIDDAGLGCPLLPGKTLADRAYVDWKMIDEYFQRIEIYE